MPGRIPADLISAGARLGSRGRVSPLAAERWRHLVCQACVTMQHWDHRHADCFSKRDVASGQCCQAQQLGRPKTDAAPLADSVGQGRDRATPPRVGSEIIAGLLRHKVPFVALVLMMLKALPSIAPNLWNPSRWLPTKNVVAFGVGSNIASGLQEPDHVRGCRKGEREKGQVKKVPRHPCLARESEYPTPEERSAKMVGTICLSMASLLHI
ncbi:hypothetical protein B0T26DRAFT_78424 [Lasiosphaeria miniovina]|uniref:Uncharacterized protein n=1 Tax=Lasiosphaeria miniovina TaxID=1954250 RepID=A0AA40BI49_9PEZI|nr:uncharacterized protein B0T26DRAFT_78424 [Lasiosphaeria miniovina]KAK0734664.1 hypothetical protein B0T26DRAFT_78424 [Lasiosphaeria miniovina]